MSKRYWPSRVLTPEVVRDGRAAKKKIRMDMMWSSATSDELTYDEKMEVNETLVDGTDLTELAAAGEKQYLSVTVKIVTWFMEKSDFLQFVCLPNGTVKLKPKVLYMRSASISEWNVSHDLLNTKNHNLTSRNPYCFSLFFGHWNEGQTERVSK